MTTAAATAPSSERSHDTKRVTVLGPDDVCRRRVCDALAKAGLLSPILVTSTEEAERVESLDVVVMPDAAPRLAVIEQLRELHERLPDAVVIVAPMDRSVAAARSALRAGAAGVVPLDRVDDALGATISAVAAGQVCLPRETRDQVGQQPLTTREKQTLALVVMGLTNCEIAVKLFLAESTVKSHLSSAFQKLGVRSRNEAAAMILDPGSGVGPGILTIPTESRPRHG